MQPKGSASSSSQQRRFRTGSIAVCLTFAVASTTAHADDKGKATYDAACSVCHATGVAGAPKFGDKSAWAPRIAAGQPALYDHALKGFQGKAGVMPPKGGNPSQSDEDVKAAVDYMVNAAK